MKRELLRLTTDTTAERTRPQLPVCHHSWGTRVTTPMVTLLSAEKRNTSRLPDFKHDASRIGVVKEFTCRARKPVRTIFGPTLKGAPSKLRLGGGFLSDRQGSGKIEINNALVPQVRVRSLDANLGSPHCVHLRTQSFLKIKLKSQLNLAWPNRHERDLSERIIPQNSARRAEHRMIETHSVPRCGTQSSSIP